MEVCFKVMSEGLEVKVENCHGELPYSKLCEFENAKLCSYSFICKQVAEHLMAAKRYRKCCHLDFAAQIW